MEEITVAIAGNPNSGKSTIFNQLTGKRQHTGNWPGVTVEKKEGRLNWKGKKITIVDLPGTYSLTPYTLDERIARDFLLKSRPDAVICVVDASNLERNLYLVIQLLEIGIPVIVDLNMMDVVKSKGMKIDSEKLSEILGTKVVETVATKGEGLGELKDAIIGSKHLTCSFSLDYGREIGQAIEEIVNLLTNTSISESYPIRWMSIKLLEGDTEAILQLGEHKEVISRVGELVAKLERCLNEDVESAMVERRYGYIEGLLRECCKRPLGVKERYELSDRIDTVVTHRLLGIPLFLLVMYITFQLVFKVGNPIADVIDIIFGWLAMHSSGILERMGSPTWLVSFVADGIIGGVGSVIVFLPNILLLFFVIGLLEDTGYLARAAFVMDKFMHTLGLHGKSSIPMILGFGCSIPGIMACRTLNSTKDRVLTILIIPLMSCSARLPIYTLFTAVFFPKHQGTVIFSLYLLGIVLAIGVAQVFQGIFFREAAAPLVMELPPYRIPNIKTVLNRMWERGAIFLKKAGTIIFGAVVFIWLLSSLPPGVEYASEQSLIGRFGSILAPLLSPAGFGFREAAIALVFGILAKEVVVSTLGTLFGAEGAGLQTAIASLFTPLSAYAFMVMSLLYIPCIAAVATIKREIGWKWAGLAMLYTTVLGWITAVIIYQGGKLLGL